jgi:hypothetical protein
VPRSMQRHQERNATSTPESEAGVLVVRRHHIGLFNLTERSLQIISQRAPRSRSAPWQRECGTGGEDFRVFCKYAVIIVPLS